MSDFKKFTDNVAAEIANFAKYIGNQTGKIVDQAKLKMAISNQEAIVDKLYKKIGEYYYNCYNEGQPIDEKMVENCKMIQMYKKSINTMKDGLKG
jgi:hypothetical protein